MINIVNGKFLILKIPESAANRTGRLHDNWTCLRLISVQSETVIRTLIIIRTLSNNKSMRRLGVTIN